MSKLQELIDKLCPNGVEYVKLGEVCNILDSQRKPISKAKRIKGNYPYYGANGIQDYISDYIFNGTFLLIGEDGSVINKDNSPVLNWVEGKIWVNNHAHILTAKKSNSLRYIYYSLQIQDVSKIVRGVPPKLNQENLKKIEIPLPPIEVQEEIVRILDNFTKCTAELQAELQAREEQYEYYRNKLLSFEGRTDVEYKKLGDIGKICMCKRILKEQTSLSGDVPFFKIGTFGGEADAYISQELFDTYKAKYSYPKKGDILISASGTIGRAVVFDGCPSYFQDSNIVWLKHDESVVLNSYLKYCYSLNPWTVSTGGTIARLYNNNILNAVIPVPSLTEQERIVNILDKFETLVKDLSQGLPAEIEARQNQYEFYRNKLLSFKRLTT